MSSLLPFIFNSIRTRAIDPANTRFFLPGVLAGIDGGNSRGKLLPLEENSWSLGEIKGSSGTTITASFASQWALFLQRKMKVDLSSQYPIASPATPWPVLSMGGDGGKVIIKGLQNVFVTPAPTFAASAGGYEISTTLEFDHWDGTDQRPLIEPLTISSPYLLKQSLCLASQTSNGQYETVCNGNGSTDINGTGTVDVTINRAFVDAVFTVEVAADDGGLQKLAVKVKSLHMGARPGDGPSIDPTNLTIDASVSPFLVGIWERQATLAIQSSSDSLFTNLNAALNEASNLEALSGQMTRNLASALDSILGAASVPAAPGQPQSTINPVDQHLFQRIRAGLNSPDSPLFIPRLLCQNASLSPLRVDVLNLPDFAVMGLPYTNGVLKGLDFNGLANVKVLPENVTLGDDDRLRFTGDLGGWNPPPQLPCPGSIPAPPAEGTAQFWISPAGAQPLAGTLAMSITSSQLSGVCRMSGADDTQLEVQMDSLSISTASPVSSIALTVALPSSGFNKIINNNINTQAVLQKILDQINTALANDLPGISAQVTSAARAAFDSSLK